MKSQKVITNLEEVEPPPWLKTRIMARLEEGVEQEEEKRWSFGRLRDLLLYPLKVKIPLQAFVVLVVVVMAGYVYRTTQPEIKLAEPPAKEVATALAPGEGKDATPRAESLQKAEERPTRGGQEPQSPSPSPAKLGADEVGKWPGGIREIFRGSPTHQPASPPALKMSEGMVKDQDHLQAASEAEPGKKAKSPTLAVSGGSGAMSAPTPGENRGRGVAKAEAEKGARQETLTLAVHMADAKAGVNDVEAVLRNLGAPVTRESKEGSSVISTEVASPKVKEIIKRLSGLGQVQQQSQYSETVSDRPVSVKIQILQKQP